MVNLFVQIQKRRHSPSLLSTLLHLGAAGLFLLAVLDSSPLPTFGGPDIVTAVLAAGHRSLWYEYAAAVTAGSILGAYLTFRLARRAGAAYLERKFNPSMLSRFRHLFEHWGTASLVTSTLVPLPSPTSLFFAAAGASEYPPARFLAIVTLCRAIRYFGLAFLAAHYGRHFLRVLRHPVQHWGWRTLLLGLTAALIAAGLVGNRRLQAAAFK